jgi:hypothetical protein
MKKKMKRTLSLVALITFLISNLVGQRSTEHDFLIENPVVEQIELVTNRALYISGEKIPFHAFYSSNLKMVGNSWSKVLYLELVRPDGTPIVQKKYSLGEKGVSGTLEVSESVLSGNYILRAYTKWMRNFPVENYAVRYLKIINPTKQNLSKSASISVKKKIEIIPFSTHENSIDIQLSKDSFAKRESVSVKLLPPETKSGTNIASISVVRKGAEFSTKINHATSEKIDTLDSFFFLPEIYGLAITGSINAHSDDTDIESQTTVKLISLDENAFFSACQTGKNNRFYLNLPGLKDEHEFFITANNGGATKEIVFDEAFCTRKVFYDLPDFELPKNEAALALELASNKQINRLFKEPETPELQTKNMDKPARPFYGKPTAVYKTIDYIDLPTLEDFLFEIVFEFRVLRKDGVPFIEMRNNHPYKAYPMLLFIDNMPVHDITKLLNIQMSKIERIEIIDNGYIVGNMKYSGMLHVITHESKFAGIELPLNSMFFRYSGYNNKKSGVMHTPLHETFRERTPDRRNCLYWNADFDLSKHDTFSFYTSDVKGEYEIILYSKTGINGKMEISRKRFVVQ